MSETEAGSAPLQIHDLRRWDVLWASALGVGFLRPAPGTWGSAVAVLFWWFVLAPMLWWQQLLVCVVYGALSWWTAHRICVRCGVKDAPQIVADEVLGIWLGLMLLPQVWWLVMAAFVLFRLLDIAKPGPIGWLDRHAPGGLGVMADDVVAGITVGVVLYFTYPVLI